MSFLLTAKLKISLLLSCFFLLILSSAIVFDIFDIRSHVPIERGKVNLTLIPDPDPDPKPKPKPKLAPKPPGCGGGGGGGGGNDDQLFQVLEKPKLLFTVVKPANLNIEDESVIETDFADQLNGISVRESGFVGISNKGNSCYADAAIQTLYRHDFIRKVVANLDIYYERAVIKTSELEKQITILESLATIDLQAISTLKLARTSIIKAIHVLEGLNHMFFQLHYNDKSTAKFTEKKSMQCMLGKFAGSGQQDADEYFIYVLGLVDDIVPASQQHHYKIGEVHGGEAKTVVDPENPGIYVKLTERLVEKVETFPKIELSLKRVDNEPLAALMDRFCAKETVTDFKIEDKSQTKHKAELERYTKLTQPPQILCLHLKRLDGTYENGRFNNTKINNPIDMPLQFDFGKWIDEGSNSYNYRLKMFITHLGTATGGHYVAYSLEANGSWYHLNDSSVSSVENIEQVRKEGYFYYYERI